MEFLGVMKKRVAMDETPIAYRLACFEKIDEKPGTYRKEPYCEEHDDELLVKPKDFGELRQGWLYVEYPFDVQHQFSVTYRTTHQLIDEIRAAFRYVYENRLFGHINHVIGDLSLEGILIDEKGRIFLYVGS